MGASSFLMFRGKKNNIWLQFYFASSIQNRPYHFLLTYFLLSVSEYNNNNKKKKKDVVGIWLNVVPTSQGAVAINGCGNHDVGSYGYHSS
jgi:hypothetical protein